MKYLFSAVLCIAFLTSYSQLSSTHYIPPFYADSSDGTITAQEQVLYLSTPHVNANYTITDGSGNVLQAGAIQNGVSANYYMLGYGTAFICYDTDLNQILTDKGLIITSDSAIYANLRVNAGSFTSPSQGGSLTSKGIDALGTTYRLGHIPSPQAHSRKVSGYAIMATQDGTTVTIDFKSDGMVFHGPFAPSSATPLNITLNAGESYVAAIHSQSSVNNLDTGFIGTLITSNKPIAVNTGSWAGSLRSNQGADIGIDQIVDLSLVGDKYVTVRGKGAGTNDDDMEQVMVVAHSNNTEIFVNGNIVATDTLNAGEYKLLDGTFYNNDVMYITTSEPTFVYQFIVGGDNTTNTQGMNFVPPITCYSAQEINSIPLIEGIGTKTYSGGITIVTKTGSTILVNGLPPTVAPVPALGSIYETYKIENLTGDVTVSTNSIALVGFFGVSGAAGYGGYYSGFDRVEFTSSVIQACPPGLLTTTSNLNGTYQWYKDGAELIGETNDTLDFSTEGDYFIIFAKEECRDTSATINILPIPSLDVGNDFYLCPGRDSIITPVATNGSMFSWFGTNPNSLLTIDSAGIYWAELKNTNNCKAIDSLIVTSDDLTFITTAVDTCSPGILTSSSSLTGAFQWYQDGVKIAGQTKDTLNFSEYGDYHVTFTHKGCLDTSSLTQIPVNPSIDLGENFTICLTKDTSIVALYDADITLAWFGNDTSDAITIDTSGIYWVELTRKGCKATDTLEVFSEDCTSFISMPNVLTPNNDGVNDFFAPIEYRNILNPALSIYNRWGMKLIIIYGLGTGWDGSIEGVKVPTGTYYWTLDYQTTNLTETFDYRINGFVQML
jgi:gliding motility-associated-like protein